MQTLSELLVKSCQTHAQQKAITFFRDGKAETELSYAELDRSSRRLAATLIRKGMSKGDRVVLNLPKSLLFVVAYLAVLRSGGILVPINPELTREEKEYLLQDADPGLIITTSQEADLIRDIAPGGEPVAVEADTPFQELGLIKSLDTESDVSGDPEPGPGDPAQIIYTSGTTGSPKGAVLTQANLAQDALKVIAAWEISKRDRLLHALPLYHVHGLCFGLNTCLLAGASLFMLNRFDPDSVLDFLSSRGKEECTLFMAVPAMYQKMLSTGDQGKETFGHIRLWTSGSAPLAPRQFERIRERFGRAPVEREGMSETGMNFSNPLHGQRKPGSIGLPLPGVKVRIVDPEQLTDKGPGEVGEIWLKSPSISPGYWNKPKETEQTFHQGWFRTGDLGRVDRDGYCFLTDRLKQIIISGGENISPKEVENTLNRLEGVLECAVFGIPDEILGERVVAGVVLQPGSGLDEKQLKTHCREHLHKWKCPKEFYFFKKLPRNSMGKVLKHKLQELARGR